MLEEIAFHVVTHPDCLEISRCSHPVTVVWHRERCHQL
jgi:hypothetical protein